MPRLATWCFSPAFALVVVKEGKQLSLWWGAGGDSLGVLMLIGR